MAQSDGRDAGAATGPDWGQLGLVVVAVLILALAAVAAPTLGGVSLAGGGDGPDGIATFGADGGDADARPGGSADDEVAGRERVAGGDEEGPGGDGLDGGDEFDGGDGATAADGDLEDGQPGDADDPGAATLEGSGDGAGEGGDGELGDGQSTVGEDGGGQMGNAELDDGTPGDVDGDGPEGDGEFGEGETGDGEFGDGDTGESGDSDDGQSGGEEFGDGDAAENGADSEQSGDGGETSGGESDGGDGDAADEGNSPDDEPPEDERADDESEDADDADPVYDVELDGRPSPGSTVEATVTRDGEPLEGATVFFDGEAVGTTDADGTVTGEVPFTRSLEVTVDRSGSASPSFARAGAGAPGFGGPTAFSGGFGAPAQVAENGTSRTFDLDPETRLVVDDPLVAGSTATVTAEVDGNPIPDGTVSVDGETVGTTDADGTATVDVPDATAVTIAVERGEIRAERTVAISELSIDVDALFPLPGRPVDVSVSDGDEPADGATVLVDGDPAGTATNGTATVDLPVAPAATVGAAVDGATAETTVDGLYRNAAALGLVGVGIAALAGRTLVRRVEVSRATLRSLPARLGRRVRRVARAFGRRAVDLVVWLADGLAGVGRRVAHAAARAGRWVAGLPRALADQGFAALAVLHPGRLVAAALAAIRALVAAARARLGELARSSPAAARGADGAGPGTEEGTVYTLRGLWGAFVRSVRPPRLRTKTPGEIGRYAIDEGFPEPPVWTVVDAFRDAEYGNAPPDEGRLERVRAAVRSVAGDSRGPDADGGRLDADGAGSESGEPVDRAGGSDGQTREAEESARQEAAPDGASGGSATGDGTGGDEA